MISRTLPIVTHMKRHWPFYWINRVNAHYGRVLERRLKPMGLNMPRWRVLISLYEETYLSVSELSETTAMRLNTTTKVVQSLTAEGLVETRVCPTDKRVTEVCLTARGDSLRAEALEEANAVLAAGFVNVTPEELQALNATLEKVFGQLHRI